MKKRNTKEIKVWMIRRKLREIDIVQATEVEQTYVNKTINGSRNNRVVLEFLRDKGCPVKYLALPKDMEKKA
ncbi:MAG: hypothetical protein VR65_19845 [Desulfobulbaceae bacterium BRH_c16a]|nr:MAG: hypothetical protein VR65_19845 [Desulfobulbaceae bacterium BRH_c16a]